MMTRRCNDCDNFADIDMLALNSRNHSIVIPCCAKCAIKLHRKPRNAARNGFYLRSSMEQEQVLRALVKT